MRIWIMLFCLLLEISLIGTGALKMWLDKEHAGRWLAAGVLAYAVLLYFAR